MTQKRAPSPPPRNRSRKKSRSPWPIYMLSGILLFFIFVSVGLHGLPGRVMAGHDVVPGTPVAAATPQPTVVPDRVSVTELPAEKHTSRARRERLKKPERPAMADPSPPAVAAPTATAENASSDAPTGTARVADDPAPAPDSAPDTPAVTPGAGDAAPPSAGFRVQAGSFPDEASARQLSDRLAAAGYRPSQTTAKNSDGAAHVVQVGPFPEKKDADAAVRDLNQQGIEAHVADE